jgi:hypothetical protein
MGFVRGGLGAPPTDDGVTREPRLDGNPMTTTRTNLSVGSALAILLALAGCSASEAARPTVEYNEQAAPLPAVPLANIQGGQPMGTVAPGPATNAPAPTTATGSAAPGGAAAAAAPMLGAAGGPAPVKGTGGAPSTMNTGGTSATGTGGASGMTPPATGAKPTMLTFQVTTVTQAGRYAPKNVGAIWVEDMAGKWIHTLEYWNSFANSGWLTRYSGASGPAYLPFFSTAPADVVTGATLPSHKAHNGMWNLKDASGAAIADGAYKLVIEVTEYSGTGKSHEYPFTVGAAATPPTVADDQYYTGAQLTLK